MDMRQRAGTNRHCAMDDERRRIHRSTSMYLRRQRDQAKRDFLQDRRSGHFDHYGDLTYMSLNDPITQGQRSVSMMQAPRSLGYLGQEQLSRNDIYEDVEDRGAEADEIRDKKLWRRSVGVWEEDRRINTKERRPVSNTEEWEEQLFSLPVTAEELEKRNQSIPLLKGKFWHRKDRIFSRWKERFFILTAKSLDCYDKCPLRSIEAPLFKVI